MIPYLKTLLPGLQSYSKTLDHNSIYVNKPWVMIDDQGNYHHYSFQKDGRLIMSLNGAAQVGSWEFLMGSKCLLIDRGKDKILLNQMFIHDAIMVLKMDGMTDTFWVLINKEVIPDLDYIKYMRDLFIRQKGLRSFQTNDNKQYYRTYKESTEEDDEVYDNNLRPLGDENISGNGQTWLVRNGRIKKVVYEKQFVSIENNNLLVVLSSPHGISYGDIVTVDGFINISRSFSILPNDANISEILLKNGRIQSYSIKQNWGRFSWLLIPFAVLVSIIVIIFFLVKVNQSTNYVVTSLPPNTDTMSSSTKDTSMGMQTLRTDTSANSNFSKPILDSVVKNETSTIKLDSEIKSVFLKDFYNKQDYSFVIDSFKTASYSITEGVFSISESNPITIIVLKKDSILEFGLHNPERYTIVNFLSHNVLDSLETTTYTLIDQNNSTNCTLKLYDYRHGHAIDLIFPKENKCLRYHISTYSISTQN